MEHLLKGKREPTEEELTTMLVMSGFSGMTPMGEVLDRRNFPDIPAIVSYGFLDVPEQKRIEVDNLGGLLCHFILNKCHELYPHPKFHQPFPENWEADPDLQNKFKELEKLTVTHQGWVNGFKFCLCLIANGELELQLKEYAKEKGKPLVDTIEMD